MLDVVFEENNFNGTKSSSIFINYHATNGTEEPSDWSGSVSLNNCTFILPASSFSIQGISSFRISDASFELQNSRSELNVISSFAKNVTLENVQVTGAAFTFLGGAAEFVRIENFQADRLDLSYLFTFASDFTEFVHSSVSSSSFKTMFVNQGSLRVDDVQIDDVIIDRDLFRTLGSEGRTGVAIFTDTMIQNISGPLSDTSILLSLSGDPLFSNVTIDTCSSGILLDCGQTGANGEAVLENLNFLSSTFRTSALQTDKNLNVTMSHSNFQNVTTDHVGNLLQIKGNISIEDCFFDTISAGMCLPLVTCFLMNSRYQLVNLVAQQRFLIQILQN